MGRRESRLQFPMSGAATEPPLLSSGIALFAVVGICTIVVPGVGNTVVVDKGKAFEDAAEHVGKRSAVA